MSDKAERDDGGSSDSRGAVFTVVRSLRKAKF